MLDWWPPTHIEADFADQHQGRRVINPRAGGPTRRAARDPGPRGPPLGSPRAPGTHLRHGHTAPLSRRPHTAHGLGLSRPQAAPQVLPVSRPRSSINTRIRVRPGMALRCVPVPGFFCLGTTLCLGTDAARASGPRGIAEMRHDLAGEEFH